MPRAPHPAPKKSPSEPSTLEVGDWLWLCRAGYETDLVDELGRAPGVGSATRLAPGLVRSPKRPKLHGQDVELAFARQGLPVQALVASGDTALLVDRLVPLVARALGSGTFVLHLFVADSDEGNLLAQGAAELEARLMQRLMALDPTVMERRRGVREASLGRDPLIQICLLGAEAAALGVTPVAQSLSSAPGGRLRLGAPKGAPSRAAAKLLEAFEWLGRAPEPGDQCVDLGAAPGGWSFVLHERRARVIAVDPARLAPHVAHHRRLHHARANAFTYLPDEPADWLLCDMAWRPLEVATLLAKWGRRGAARFLVANIKLPMKQKVEMVRRVREIVESGGWREVRVRQLYHDRDEVTLGAWRLR